MNKMKKMLKQLFSASDPEMWKLEIVKRKKKLAVFDIDMQQYYDYLISQEVFQDSIEVYYSFTVRMKKA